MPHTHTRTARNILVQSLKYPQAKAKPNQKRISDQSKTICYLLLLLLPLVWRCFYSMIYACLYRSLPINIYAKFRNEIVFASDKHTCDCDCEAKTKKTTSRTLRMSRPTKMSAAAAAMASRQWWWWWHRSGSWIDKHMLLHGRLSNKTLWLKSYRK